MLLRTRPLFFGWIAASAWASAASAACTSSSWTFCNGCVHTKTITADRDSACSFNVAGGPNVVKRISLLQRARNGVAGTSPFTFAYKPNPGFAGSDSFSVRIDYQGRSGEAESLTINAVVTVR